jgi:hypothetical protein
VSSLVSTVQRSFPVLVLAILFLIVFGSSLPAKRRGGGSDAVKKLKKQKVAESE